MRKGNRSYCNVTFLIASIVAAMLCGTANAPAESFPARPVTMVVPFPAGGPTDVIGRILAERMRVALGQPVVIENVVGGSGNVATGRVARAAPDGYTMIFGTSSTHVINGATLSLPYDLVADFEPVARVVDSPMLLVAKKAIPANNLNELIAWLRAHPDEAIQGTPGPASTAHLAGALFQKLTDTRFRFVAYRGVGPAIRDLVAGRIDLVFDLVANSLSQVRAGNIKAYAVFADKRLASMPEVPTAAEAGRPDLEFYSWQALWVPKGTPKNVIARLNAAVTETLRDPAVRQRLTDLAQTIPPPEQQTPAALGAFQKAEIEKWWPIVKAAHVKAQ